MIFTSQGLGIYSILLQSSNMAARVKLAANLSFLFQDRQFLDRFDAAAACGESYRAKRQTKRI